MSFFTPSIGIYRVKYVSQLAALITVT